MKDKILRKLIKISKKNKILRIPMLSVIFIYLGSFYLLNGLYEHRMKLLGTLCTMIVFLLSSSFALPVLLDMDEEGRTEYATELEQLLAGNAAQGSMQEMESSVNGTVLAEEILLEDEDVTGDGFEDYESYDVTEVDTYQADEILSANEQYMERNRDASAGNGEDTAAFSSEDWRLVLINKQHPIPEDYSFQLTTITGTMQCDERILADLLNMLQAAQEDGISLVICSPYRDLSKQQVLFDRKIRVYMNKGLSYMDAYKITSQAVTVPGASEHQIGLALDIYSTTYTVLDEGFGETPAGKWLAEHGCEYGFTLRYPKDKEYITGIEYEPWHFRYVGVDAAMIMKEQNITLEEFWETYVE